MENQKPQPFKNWTKRKRTSSLELSERDGIVIAITDKGGAVVIIDIKYNVKEVEKQLKTRDN